VIELEHERIRFSAVEARMHAQVLENAETIFHPIAVHSRDLARDVGVAVVQVVLPAVRRVAHATVVLSHTRLDRSEREVGLGLELMTHRASAHGATPEGAPLARIRF
jgi:hypothetical protein